MIIGHVAPVVTDTAPSIAEQDNSRLRRLRPSNAFLAVLHAAQGVAILVLATDFTLPVTASYLDAAPGTSEPPAPSLLFDSRIAWWVAAFLFCSAVAHLLLSTVLWRWYGGQLARRRNVARWVEYSLSASIMIVLIAQLAGISDIAALLALFGVNAAMIFFGLVQEVTTEPGSGRWLPFNLGCVVGAVPWVVIAIYLLGPGADISTSPPGFVVAIFVSLFLFFNVFALNMWLQYAQVGRWRDYLWGEGVYMLLSLTAKSALAWQVFAGTLTG